MEMHSLQLTVTESDLEQLVRNHLLTDKPIEEFRLSIGPDGILATGLFQMFLDVRFESLWELAVRDGLACARLAGFKALGIPGNIFKSAIFKFLGDMVNQDEALSVEGDWLRVDLEKLIARYALPCRVNLTGMTTGPGVVRIEAGS